MEGCRVLGFQGCRALVLELFLLTDGAAGFYIPKGFRKQHFSEFKGSNILVFEFFSGFECFKGCGFESFRVRGLEGSRVLGFQGCRALHTKKISETTLFRV